MMIKISDQERNFWFMMKLASFSSIGICMMLRRDLFLHSRPYQTSKKLEQKPSFLQWERTTISLSMVVVFVKLQFPRKGQWHWRRQAHFSRDRDDYSMPFRRLCDEPKCTKKSSRKDENSLFSAITMKVLELSQSSTQKS